MAKTMKTRIWANLRSSFSSGPSPHLTHLTYLACFGLSILPLAGCLQQSSFSPSEAVAAATEPSTSPQTDAASTPATELSPDTDTEEALAAADDQAISTAPAEKVSTEIQVPANLKPTPATAEIIKLANAGVDQGVMLSFVTNSVGTFNLRAEEIIYLNDIGVPSAVVTAMIQRDHLIQGTSADVTLAPAETQPSAAYPPANAPDAMPESTPPQFSETPPLPDYPAENYPVPSEPEPSPTDYADYYDSLAPYGNWVDVEGSGRCWQPTVVIANPGWRPYFNCGRWVYTDCGWYWMSDYSWGWAPFHYGRWFQHATLGWCWQPDRVWGPSWVCWRHDRDYCGWAPLPPGARFVAGIGLTFHGHPVRNGFSFGLAANHFPFVPFGHFLDRNLPRHAMSHDHVARIFDHTTASTGIIPHNHTVLNNGLPRDQVAAATHLAIRPAVLHNVSPTEGVGIRERFEHNGRSLAVYRPDLSHRDIRPAPGPGHSTQPPLPNRAVNSSLADSGHTYVAPVPPLAPRNPGLALQNPARNNEPRLRPGQPLILHGTPQVRQPLASGNPGAFRNPRGTVPLNSLTVTGQRHDPRLAATQPDNPPSWTTHTRPSTHDWRNSPMASRDDEYDQLDAIRRPQNQAQSTWWGSTPRVGGTQPQQLQPFNREQFRQNQGGNWNANFESPRYNSMPVHTPEHVRSAPMESHQSHSAPVESHVSRSEPPVDHSSHSAPAPSSSSASHNSSSSSSSSGHGR